MVNVAHEPGTAAPRVAVPSTTLSVFPICLGGNVFGWTADEAASFEVLDAYFSAGGNMVDTADQGATYNEHAVATHDDGQNPDDRTFRVAAALFPERAPTPVGAHSAATAFSV